MQFPEKKSDPPLTLLNGQAGIDVNDRCEVAKILHTQPETIVFVFAGGRQTGEQVFCCVHYINVTLRSLKKVMLLTCAAGKRRESYRW